MPVSSAHGGPVSPAPSVWLRSQQPRVTGPSPAPVCSLLGPGQRVQLLCQTIVPRDPSRSLNLSGILASRLPDFTEQHRGERITWERAPGCGLPSSRLLSLGQERPARGSPPKPLRESNPLWGNQLFLERPTHHSIKHVRVPATSVSVSSLQYT